MSDTQKALYEIARSALYQLQELRRDIAQEVRLTIECLDTICESEGQVMTIIRCNCTNCKYNNGSYCQASVIDVDNCGQCTDKHLEVIESED